MPHVIIPIPGGAPYGHAGDLEAGPEALARAIETQDNAPSKRRGKRALN